VTTKAVNRPPNRGQSSVLCSDISPGPATDPPRKHFEEDALNELTASSKDLGGLDPIRVPKAPDEHTFNITAGEGRRARRAPSP